jgi:D-beta-D-heptose 7-phosphate kinase/D-beta-D-heptose 1-phosphate adenosyltransferase
MNNDRNLIPSVENLATGTVGCVGDLMLDHFIYGDVNRISPEAPIPVLRIDSQKSMLGGLGNVVRNLGALGCGIKVFSVTGEDNTGSEIDGLLRQVPRCQNHLVREAGRTTPVKVRYVAAGQQLLRTDQETTGAISAASLSSILAEFEHAIAACSVIVLSDYAKGVLVGPLAAEFIRVAKKLGKFVIVDPKGSDFSRYRHATLIKPNLKELGEAAGDSVSGTAAQERAARKLIQQTEAEYILVTRGPDGMLLVPHDGPSIQLPSLAREVFDVSGAGDTVAATLAAGIAAGASVVDAVKMANIAAGIVVGKTGTAIVERSEIVHEIENQSAAVANDKVLQLNEATERAAMWHRMGLKIGLIFGSFERLSPEELSVVEKARRDCDRLVVAIQGDKTLSVNGETAAFPDQRARAYLLASTVFSDAVIICDNLTPERVLSAVHPDIITMATNSGADIHWMAAWHQRNGLTSQNATA